MRHGFIVAFSGTFSNGYPIDTDTGLADTDWHLCDGTNGTPDLSGRFILGASDTHTAGSTGGEETHTLTINEMPKHTHRIACTSAGWLNNKIPQSIKAIQGKSNDNINGVFTDRTVSGNYTDGGKGYYVNSEFLESTGGNAPHNNMPPYYALSYIMKL